MSRNLGTTTCNFCYSEVVLLEAARPPTKKEVGAYTEYLTALFARAECPVCLAQYFAWCSINTEVSQDNIKDLSFYHSFNDEPDERDLPRYKTKHMVIRDGIFTDSIYFDINKQLVRK